MSGTEFKGESIVMIFQLRVIRVVGLKYNLSRFRCGCSRDLGNFEVHWRLHLYIHYQSRNDWWFGSLNVLSLCAGPSMSFEVRTPGCSIAASLTVIFSSLCLSAWCFKKLFLLTYFLPHSVQVNVVEILYFGNFILRVN